MKKKKKKKQMYAHIVEGQDITKEIAPTSLVIQIGWKKGRKMKTKVVEEVNKRQGPSEEEEEHLVSMWYILV